MKLLQALVGLALAAPALSVAVWGQCGGTNYTGSTSCDSGLTCVVVNSFYYQCQTGTGGGATSTTTTTTTASIPTNTLSGFVKTSGQKFTLNGAAYTLIGANSYWVGLAGLSNSDMDKAFSDIAATGATTVRTWGFNDVTSANGVYYQSWSGSTATVNTGPTGLGNFDNVVALAGSHGLRLIVTLTNNWSDYGGMDVYVKQIVGSSATHDVFYTNTAVKTAYKNYIKQFVGRYSTNPVILGWELANEPRCSGSTGTKSASCTTATITAWVKEISAYIKSIDSNHLVSLGDEGFFNQPSNPSYPYQGSEGIDFNANLAVSSIDFGTVHLYPVGWGQTSDPTGWGSQWITDHATSQKSANKPVILEEFGVTDSQASTYTAWYSTVVSSGLTGDLIWQAGTHFSSGSSSSDDGYTIYPDDPVYALEKTHTTALKARG